MARPSVFPADKPTHPEEAMTRTVRTTTAALAALALAGSGLALSASTADARQGSAKAKPVSIEVFAPEQGANAGIAGTGWFVDMEVDFKTRNLAATGFNGLQLTGPAGHNNIPPAPGLFGVGHDDKMPGLVVLTSTTSSTLAGLLRAGHQPGRPVQPHRRHQPRRRGDGALGHLARRCTGRRQRRGHRAHAWPWSRT